MPRLKLRVAILTPLYEPSIGGVQETLRLWVRYFSRQSSEVCVYTSQLRSLDELKIGRWKNIRNFPEEEKKDGVLVRRYPYGGAMEFFLGLVYALCYHLHLPLTDWVYNLYRRHSFRESLWCKEITIFRPQVILVAPCTEYLLDMAYRAKRITGAKIIVKTALHLESEKASHLKRIFQKLKCADALFVNTTHERDVLAPFLPETSLIHVNSIGVDVEAICKPYSEEEVDPDLKQRLAGKAYVLFLARKQQGKGMAALAHTARRLNKEFPELLTVLAGEETEYSVKEVSKLLDNADFILTPGAVSEATKQWLFKNASIFCMVSRVDSYGIVYCEAWLHGVPVIAADTPQMRCVVRDGQDGLLVDYDDDLRLADAIRVLLKDPALAKRMGESGRQKVLKEFGNHAMEKRIFELMIRLVQPQ